MGGVMATRGAMGGGGGGVLASAGQKLHPASVSTLGDFTAGGPAPQSATPAFRNAEAPITVAELGGEKVSAGHFIAVGKASRPLSTIAGQGKALLPVSGPLGSTTQPCGNGGELTGGGGAGSELEAEVEVGGLDCGFCSSTSLTTELLLLQPIPATPL